MEDIPLGNAPPRDTSPKREKAAMDGSSKKAMDNSSRKEKARSRQSTKHPDREKGRSNEKHSSKSKSDSKKKSSSSSSPKAESSSSAPELPVRRLAQKIVLDETTDVFSLLIQAFSAHRICKHVRINRAFFKKLTAEQSSQLLDTLGELPRLEIFEIDFPPREGHPLIAQALASFLKKAKRLNTITLCNLELSGETDVMIDALNNHPSLRDVKILLLQEGVPHLIHS